jgi:hypothetical protein
MATQIRMRHRETGLVKTGFYGFSWTTLFFGSFPALFRMDFITFIGTFVVYVILGTLTAGIGAFIASIVWAFFYNSYYTRKLIAAGYRFDSGDFENRKAADAIGMVPGQA